MVILVAAEQCGEQFSVLPADRRLELAHYPVKMEREMCILTAIPIYPHLFRCLISTGNFSRGVSPPPTTRRVLIPSLPVSRAYAMTRRATGNGSRSVRRPAEPPGAMNRGGPSLAMATRLQRAHGAPAPFLRSWPRPVSLAWAGQRTPGGHAGDRQTRDVAGRSRACDSRPVASRKRYGTNLNADVDWKPVEFRTGETAETAD